MGVKVIAASGYGRERRMRTNEAMHQTHMAKPQKSTMDSIKTLIGMTCFNRFLLSIHLPPSLISKQPKRK